MELKISRVLHAGYVFDDGTTKIIFDPIFENPFSNNCFAFPSVNFDIQEIQKIKWTGIFVSHFHDDHLSLESLNLIDRNTPIYLYCVHDELFSLIKSLGFFNVQSLEVNSAVTIGGFKITPRKALDPDVDCIFHIQAGELNILNVVDAWIDPWALDLLSDNKMWDLILWPFQTLRELQVLAPTRAEAAVTTIPGEWIQQLMILNPRAVVPSSCQFIHEPWSWYNQTLFPISYQQFSKQVLEAVPHTKVIRLDPSESIILTSKEIKLGSSLKWVELLDKEKPDYAFDPNLKPPLTSEISKNFPALTIEQKTSVFDFCKSVLVEKFNSLEIPDDDYFNKAGCWQLALYDNRGQKEIIYYHFLDGKIELATDLSENLIWLTEVPIFKIFSALSAGESLTSMYVRINDIAFDNEIENYIQTADILCDPLIRCLFTGKIGSYQAAQLRRLLIVK